MIDPEAIVEARHALGRQLAALRQAAGLNQAQLAERIVGYGRSTVANVEIGRQNAGRDFWQRCERALGSDVLMTGYGKVESLVRQRHLDGARAITGSDASPAGGAPDLLFVAGAEDRAADESMWLPARTAEEVNRFTAGDLTIGRREANRMLAALLVGAALTEPLEHWVSGRPAVAEPARRGSLGEDDVAHIEAFARALRHWDNRFRLGIRRKAVVGQLNEVAELVKAGQSPAVTRRLFVVLAELAKIAASMAFDAGLHPTAQRYYLFALRASDRAGDRLLGANVLADMARQLLDLKHPADALELVRLALDAVEKDAPPRVVAMLRTREAWAYAALGRVQAFRRAAAAAQDSFAAGGTGATPYWLRHFDEAELSGVIGARFRDVAVRDVAVRDVGSVDTDLARLAVGHIQHALRVRHPRRLRNRAFDLIGLGRAYLVLGEAEEACRVAGSALDLAGRVGSGRVEARLRDFHAESARFTRNRTVASFRAELRHRLAAA